MAALIILGGDMPFTPFTQSDFFSLQEVSKNNSPDSLRLKIDDLREGLAQFPEYNLDFFKNRIARRPGMRGSGGLVFGEPHFEDKYWFLYTVGGDQDQVQLNIAMFPEYIRVGLGFMMGRQDIPKMPAFHVFQTFLGARPPIPFRDALFESVKNNNLRLEGYESNDPKDIIERLETYVVHGDRDKDFIFIGHLWNPEEARHKQIEDYREAFLEFMPFYEELLLAGGRYRFYI